MITYFFTYKHFTMKQEKINVLFYLKKNKVLKNGKSPICMRITINKLRVEMNIRKSISPELWDQKKECAIPYDSSTIELNKHIHSLKSSIYHIYHQLSAKNEVITPQTIKQELIRDYEVQGKYLIRTFNEHNQRCRELLGIDCVYSTVNRYKLCSRYLTEMLQEKKRVDDILLKDVSGELIRDFIHYLKTKKKLKENTVVKYMKCLKKITNRAIADGWLNINPFASVKLKTKEVERIFLTPDELKSIIDRNFDIPRLQLVKDIFLFCTFTGLSFIDVKNLSPRHIIKDQEGNLWVHTNRQKTNNICSIPLLNVPILLLDKYKGDSTCIEKNVCFPVPCNQKFNSYLKEIADFCGIKKVITSHTARRTFASVITLANGIPIEMVAKILGHADLRMTMLYTHIFDQNVYNKMININSRI